MFQLDAEVAHNWTVSRLKKLKNSSFLPLIRKSLQVEDARLYVNLDSHTYTNPVGLAAGFDKGAELMNVLPHFGFGFVEVGTLTPLPQPGQNKPRLFRYKQNQALINRMGFNNPGIHVLEGRFSSLNGSRSTPIGINLGKNKVTPNDKAVDDYLMGFQQAHEYGDYVVVNVSSPNTPGLRDLQATETLKEILSSIQKNNKKGLRIYTKVSPDLHNDTLSDITELCLKHNSGLIATNTTLDHSSIQDEPDQRGGLSGEPLKTRANEVLSLIYGITKGKVPLIGVGGIANAEDAYEKICLGANLVQIYTGWIFQGPGLVPQINKGLLELMDRDGFSNIQDAVGTK